MKKNLFLFLCFVLLVVPAFTQTTMKKQEMKDTNQEQTLKMGQNHPKEMTIQKKDVPEKVITNFEKAYPKAKIDGYAKWDDKEQTFYSINCVDGKMERHIVYDKTGKVTSSGEVIKYSELPKPVQDALTKDYPKGKASRCERVLKGTVTTFEIMFLTPDKVTLHLAYSEEGKQIRNENEKEYQ